MLSVYTEKCSSGFTKTFAQCCLCHLVSHRISLNPKQLARPPGVQECQDSLPFFSEVPLDLLCLQTGSESRQVRSKVRGLLSTFSFTMGSWGPCVFEPRHPYSASSSASPKTVNASYFSQLFWGHSFFQWLKPRNGHIDLVAGRSWASL